MLRVLCILVSCCCLQSTAFAEANQDYGYASFAANSGHFSTSNCISQQCYDTFFHGVFSYSIPTDFGAVALEYHDKEMYTGDWVNVQAIPVLKVNTDYIRALDKRMDLLAGIKLGAGSIRDYCGGVAGSCSSRIEMDYGLHLGLNVALGQTEKWVAKLDLSQELMRELFNYYDGLGQTAVMTTSVGISYRFNKSNELSASYSLMSYSTQSDNYSTVLSSNSAQEFGIRYAYHFDTRKRYPTRVKVDY